MSRKSLFYQIGYRLGWWYEENKHMVRDRLLMRVLGRIPVVGQLLRWMR